MELSDSRRMKAADKTAIEERGIDSLRLMETAAGYVCEAAEELSGERLSAAVFCGPGNNGGDGVAAARMLIELGYDVRVWLVGKREKMTADTLAMEARLQEAGGSIEDYSNADPLIAEWVSHAGVVVDALFGVGLSRPLTGAPLDAVRLINSAGIPVVSADIPSGISADTGVVMGAAVRADCTVTFSRAKPGHFVEPGCVFCGELRVKDIGIPRDLVESSGCGVFTVHEEDLRLPVREKLSHKGDYGKLLILAGSVPYTGAPTLCAKAAVRAGAGLVYLGIPKDIYEITAIKNEEAMPFPRDQIFVDERLSQCDVCVIGPGMGRSGDTITLTEKVLRSFAGPVVADADAIWAIAQDMTVLDEAKAVVLTPHEGEFARLLGRPIDDRLQDSLDFAAAHNCTLVLKGYRTICAFSDGSAYVIDAGNPGMATGGSGDVLAGVLGAMLCQIPLRRAVLTACWLHARAGDIAAGQFGEYALKAGDIIDFLPQAEKEILG